MTSTQTNEIKRNSPKPTQLTKSLKDSIPPTTQTKAQNNSSDNRKNMQLKHASSLDSLTSLRMSRKNTSHTNISLFDTEKLRRALLGQIPQQGIYISQSRKQQSLPKWLPPNFFNSYSSNKSQNSNQNLFSQIVLNDPNENETKKQNKEKTNKINIFPEKPTAKTGNKKETNFLHPINQEKTNSCEEKNMNTEGLSNSNNTKSTTRNKKKNKKKNQKPKPRTLIIKTKAKTRKKAIMATKVIKKNKKTNQKQRQTNRPRRLIRSKSIEPKLHSTLSFLRKRRMELNDNLNKLPDKQPTALQSLKINSSIVENGKDLFKLLTGQLWVISGGASQKILTPFTNQFAMKIGQILGASEKESTNVKSQLKYLLSNSRRTLTEFVLEILVSVLSLIHTDPTPSITIKFWELLNEIVNLDYKEGENANMNVGVNVNINLNEKGGNDFKMQVEDNENDNDDEDGDEELEEEELEEGERKERGLFKQENLYNNNNNNNQKKIFKNKINEKKSFIQEENSNTQTIKKRLEEIYQDIFTERVLMFWFEKRFIDRLDSFILPEQKQAFFKQHLFFLGKSKFILSCLLLAKELIRKGGVTKSYSMLINLEYNNLPLNLYVNNRGKKVNLIKELISKYGANNGNYWEIISKDYVKQMKFNPNNIFEVFPFKNIITNPKISNLSQTMHLKQPIKKKQFPNKRDEPNLKIGLEWLKK
ncbi:hypothetical protein M0812_00052 [Anaeramoeba flamelloides]|uniref:Uncharacterized protein n=1 Tax=Anaeramoeba flamelloides TaxID=1746091 RepID=A0AAV8A3K6_9EUKA|nr:hypothetical protein M0812_00052 [Anaeramoeba flamelloides]